MDVRLKKKKLKAREWVVGFKYLRQRWHEIHGDLEEQEEENASLALGTKRKYFANYQIITEILYL